MTEHPNLRLIVLDAVDVAGLAGFYRDLLGLKFREEDVEGASWLTLLHPVDNRTVLAVQGTDELRRATWPDPTVPQQLHLDMTVDTYEQLTHQRDRALALGATVLRDRSDDPDDRLLVFADPEGHPFCIYVAQEGAFDGPPLT